MTNTNLREIMKNAPNSVLIICGTAIFVTVVGAFVIFGVTGSDATEFRAFLNTLVNLVTLVLAGSATVVAGAAAKSAGKAEEQTNGALDGRIQKAVSKALETSNERNGNGRPSV